MQRGIVMHTVQNITNVASSFSKLYGGPVQNSYTVSTVDGR